MTDESLQDLYAELAGEEGVRLSAYQDSLGYWTIGAGRLIDARKNGGITRDEAMFLLRNDVARTEAELDVALPWWRQLDDVRQRVIVDMAFNMGVGLPRQSGLLSFGVFLGHLQAGHYENAATAMLQSLWAVQVGARATRLANMIRTGAVSPAQA